MNIRAFLALAGALSVVACSSGAGGSGTVTPQSLSQSSPNALYQVTELPSFGGALGSAASINEREWTTGAADEPGDAVSHAALWINGASKDLGTLGGPSSAISWPNLNTFGTLSGISEKAAMNAYNEPWSCWGFFLPYTQPTGHVCLGFRWQNNTMTPLPTLGGQDGYAAGNNNEGQIVGWAENTTRDSTCTNGQVLQFEPVMWDAANNAHQLPTLPGDPDGAATAINDAGAVVGISGICDQAVGRFTAKHVVIWQHGVARELFDSGGSVSWNTPQAINQRGDVTGFINMPGAADQAGQLQPIAFLRTHDGTLTKIPPLSGDAYSFGNGINDEGDVVGISFGAGFSTARAFIYHDGKAYDLNGLVPSGSPALIAANGVDDRLTIVGQASDATNNTIPAFIAHLTSGANFDAALAKATTRSTQATQKPFVLSMRLRQQLLRRFGIR